MATSKVDICVKFEENNSKPVRNVELNERTDGQTTLKHVGPDCRWHGRLKLLAPVALLRR